MARGLMVLVAVLTVGAACGSAPISDVARLESDIPAALVPEAPEVVTDVDCPDVIVRGPTRTRCTAAIAGAPVSVEVDVSADDEAAISTDAVVLEVGEMAAVAGARLTADLGVETTVVCAGGPVVVSVPDTRLECDAIDASGSAHAVVLTVRSEVGDWDLAIAP